MGHEIEEIEQSTAVPAHATPDFMTEKIYRYEKMKPQNTVLDNCCDDVAIDEYCIVADGWGGIDIRIQSLFIENGYNCLISISN